MKIDYVRECKKIIDEMLVNRELDNNNKLYNSTAYLKLNSSQKKEIKTHFLNIKRKEINYVKR